MSNPAVNLQALHEAMKSQLAAKFTGHEVDYYPRPGDKVKCPAIFIELDEIEPEGTGDIGTEQFSGRLRFCGYCVLDYKSGNKLAVRLLAAAMVAFLHNKQWIAGVQGAEVIGAWPDKFKRNNPPSDTNTEEYECWRVEWTHAALLGVDAWAYTGEHPTEVYVGEDPKTGEDNEDKYKDILAID